MRLGDELSVFEVKEAVDTQPGPLARVINWLENRSGVGISRRLRRLHPSQVCVREMLH